jgi:hypothetical protein
MTTQLLEQACALPDARSASGYTLYRIDDIAIVMFGADRRQVCDTASVDAPAGALQYWTRDRPDLRRAER